MTTYESKGIAAIVAKTILDKFGLKREYIHNETTMVGFPIFGLRATIPE